MVPSYGHISLYINEEREGKKYTAYRQCNESHNKKSGLQAPNQTILKSKSKSVLRMHSVYFLFIGEILSTCEGGGSKPIT